VRTATRQCRHDSRDRDDTAVSAFRPRDATATPDDRTRWFDAGGKFVGASLPGLESKIGYLRRLGVTAIWISPVFKQVPAHQSYHGYGIQNFLDVDPHFGTRDNLVSLVRTAHQHGIRVILDVILNHSGDVFAYRPEQSRCDVFDQNGNFIGKEACRQADGAVYGVSGFRDSAGNPTLPFEPVTTPTGLLGPADSP
jgi:glycosidase